MPLLPFSIYGSSSSLTSSHMAYSYGSVLSILHLCLAKQKYAKLCYWHLTSLYLLTILFFTSFHIYTPNQECSGSNQPYQCLVQSHYYQHLFSIRKFLHNTFQRKHLAFLQLFPIGNCKVYKQNLQLACSFPIHETQTEKNFCKMYDTASRAIECHPVCTTLKTLPGSFSITAAD